MDMSRATKKCNSVREVKVNAKTVRHFKVDPVLNIDTIFV